MCNSLLLLLAIVELCVVVEEIGKSEILQYPVMWNYGVSLFDGFQLVSQVPLLCDGVSPRCWCRGGSYILCRHENMHMDFRYIVLLNTLNLIDGPYL